MIEKLKDLVNRVGSTASRLEKEAILSEFNNDEDIKDVLHFLYNPYIVSGISDKKLAKHKDLPPLIALSKDEGLGNVTLVELIEYFKKNNTGRDIDVQFLVVSAESLGEKELIYSLVKKDLKLGIQEKTLNKVYGEGFIPTLSVMLAESYAENMKHIEGKEFILTEKFDGIRCVLIFTEGTPTFFTRNGRTIADMVEIAEEVMSLDQSYVYDGELLLNAEMDNAADLYRATVKITSSDNIKRNIIFNIFDKIIKDDFQRGHSPQTAVKRKQSYIDEISIISLPHIKPAPILYVGNDISKIQTVFEDQILKGSEGIMVNVANAPYQAKRTKDLLKVKKFHAADVLVEELEEGSGANKGKLGAVIVKFLGSDGKHHRCRVGSGFKQDEREHFWQNPDELKGKIIEIGYFEMSKNQHDDALSLRFPTFKYIRDDKAEISMH